MRFPHPIVILRHPKERKSKCTMQPMRWAPGFFFHNATPDLRYDATGHLLLALDAPVLSIADGAWAAGEREQAETRWNRNPAGCPPRAGDFREFAGRPILLLDATWRRLPAVARCVVGNPIHRSLPTGLRTAYPRVNAEGLDPERGLATIEALYVALRLLGIQAEAVLERYRWKDPFLTGLPPLPETSNG